MGFEIGETVVYPHHGAATIKEIKERVIQGRSRLYLTLHAIQGDLTIQVPAENVEKIGVRDVIDESKIGKIVDILEEAEIDEPDNWSRRFKVNIEKISTGETESVAEVVRDLTRRERERALSSGEKKILTRARQVLVSEIALARGISEEDAQARLDFVLARGCGDEMPDVEFPGGPIPESGNSR
ncbi:CarD family transcriptional regulator [Actinomycetaceae bacterium TAE3-ERU4]|nr:CarD family transcriptional regulator [Actinomycetaceae bacterium TAE3-ERU4]